MSNREAFEEWYKSEYPLDYEHYVNEQNIGVFTKLYLRCFASWSASASREGYVVVPKEPTCEMVSEGFKEMCVVDMRDFSDESAVNIYKAMLEAVEK